MGKRPVSRITVAVQIALEPDIGGYSVDSMMMKPKSASGWFDGSTILV